MLGLGVIGKFFKRYIGVYRKIEGKGFIDESSLRKVAIFRRVLLEDCLLCEKEAEFLAQLLINYIDSRAFSDAGRNHLVDSMIRRARYLEIDKIRMILTGEGMETHIFDRN